MLRWPQRRLELRQGYAPRLLELFEDYELACEAADHWRAVTSPEGRSRAEEYRVLAREIEQDIEETLTTAVYSR